MTGLDLAAAAVGTAVGILTILGVLYKVVLLPNLREQLFRPIEETHRQVTQNKHVNREPTLVDRVDEVSSMLEDMRRELTARADRNQRLSTAAGQRADGAHKRLDDHEAWASAEDRRLWQAIGRHVGERESDDT